jgi:hypothetical protein
MTGEKYVFIMKELTPKPYLRGPLCGVGKNMFAQKIELLP